jgi:hypothetical protein
MKNLLCCVFVAALLFTSGCAQRENTLNKNAPIGTATMTEDGTITLHLRAEGPGIIGHGQLVYSKDNKDYADVLQHLGGLKPGESKLVPPWPDKE